MTGKFQSDTLVIARVELSRSRIIVIVLITIILTIPTMLSSKNNAQNDSSNPYQENNSTTDFNAIATARGVPKGSPPKVPALGMPGPAGRKIHW